MSKEKNDSFWGGKEVSPEQLAAFSMDDHVTALMWKEPFYADVMRSLTKVETTDIPTAGVIQKGRNLTMFWNRKFCASLNVLQVQGLLRHEALHLVFMHTTARRYDPHWVWNWATDLAINSFIPENELPEGGLIPGKPFATPPPEVLEKMSSEEIARREKISALIASFPREQSSEWYFGLLMSNETIKEMEKERKLNEAAFKEALRRLKSSMGGGQGDHDGWDDNGEMTDEERQMLEGKVREIIRAAKNRADSSNSWGSVSASMQEWIRSMFSGEIPWQSVLRQFVGQAHRDQQLSTWTKMNRKSPLSSPGVTHNYHPRISVYVDQSGSVCDESLALFFGELSSLSKRATFTVYYFDTEVDVQNSFEWRKGCRVTPQRTRCGGTDFSAPTKHANDDKNCEAYIILTDGGADRPEPSRKRRAWVLDPGHDLAFGEADKKDIIIKMKGVTK